jgi:hypothetical protein
MVEDIIDIEDAGNDVTEARPQEAMSGDGKEEETTTIEDNNVN